jgi:hypothetical protein
MVWSVLFRELEVVTKSALQVRLLSSFFIDIRLARKRRFTNGHLVLVRLKRLRKILQGLMRDA